MGPGDPIIYFHEPEDFCMTTNFFKNEEAYHGNDVLVVICDSCTSKVKHWHNDLSS